MSRTNVGRARVKPVVFKSNDPRTAMHALLAGLDRTGRPGVAATVMSFLTAADDPELAKAVNDLSRGNSPSSARATRLRSIRESKDHRGSGRNP